MTDRHTNRTFWVAGVYYLAGDSFGDPAHSLIFLEQKKSKKFGVAESHLLPI